MKLTKLTIAMYVGLLFLSGVAVGAFGHRLYTVAPVNAMSTRPNSEAFRKKYLNDMQTRLNLNAEQMTKLESVLDDTRSKYHAVRDRTRPEFESIRNEQAEKVRSMLTDTQRTEYEKMRKEREQRDSQTQHGRGSGPGF